jgi:acyl-CoA thioesterase FadM
MLRKWCTRPGREYFEDAFLAWLDRECGGYESLRAGGDDFVIVQSQCRYVAVAF